MVRLVGISYAKGRCSTTSTSSLIVSICSTPTHFIHLFNQPPAPAVPLLHRVPCPRQSPDHNYPHTVPATTTTFGFNFMNEPFSHATINRLHYAHGITTYIIESKVSHSFRCQSFLQCNRQLRATVGSQIPTNHPDVQSIRWTRTVEVTRHLFLAPLLHSFSIRITRTTRWAKITTTHLHFAPRNLCVTVLERTGREFSIHHHHQPQPNEETI